MPRLPDADYIEVLETAARLARNGLVIYRWEPDEPLPRYEWANEPVLARTKMPAESLLESYEFLTFGDNARLAHVARARALRADESPFDVELTNAAGDSYWLEAVVHPLDPSPSGALRFVVATHPIDRRKAHERFGRLLSAAIDAEQDGVFIVRLDGENLISPPVIYANPAFLKLTGYTQDDLASGIYPRIFGVDTDRSRVSGSALTILRGEPVTTELQLYRKDGTPFWSEVRAHPLETPAVHCAISIHDVTDRRRAQEAMNFLSEGVAQASDFIIVMDETPLSEGGPKVLHVNRSFLEATGFGDEDVVGQPYTAIYSSNNTPALMGAIRNAIEADQPNYREVLARRKDGTEFWIEFVDRPFMTRHGRRLRLMVGRDITVRRRSSNQLSLLFAATEQASTPVIIYEPDEDAGLAVSYENEAAAERKHYHLLYLWNRDNDEARAIRDRLERGESAVTTYALSKRTGPNDLVQMTARPVRNESRLEAVLTQERVLTGNGTVPGRARPLLVDIALMLPTLQRAVSPAKRLETLRTLLRSAFDASIEIGDEANAPGVQIDERNRAASFSYEGRTARVSWHRQLEPLAITALRFCLEAAIAR